MISSREQAHDAPSWRPTRPKLRPLHLVVAWLVAATSLLIAAWIVPGASVNGFLGALAAALAIALLNAIVPPVLAALRLPLQVLTGLILILIADALMLLAADRITDGDLQVDSFWSALGVAFVASAVTVVIDVVLGTNDDDTYTLRVTQRIASARASARSPTRPGFSSSRSTGSPCPSSAGRCRTAARRRWPAGWRKGRTGWPSGRPTSPPRPARASRGSCWA